MLSWLYKNAGKVFNFGCKLQKIVIALCEKIFPEIAWQRAMLKIATYFFRSQVYYFQQLSLLILGNSFSQRERFFLRLLANWKCPMPDGSEFENLFNTKLQ